MSSGANGKRVLLVASTTGYQTRMFAEAATRIGIEPVLATDRCHVLPDPWGDQAIPLRFEEPEKAGREAAQAAGRVHGVVAVGDRPAEIAAHAATVLDLPFHPPHAAAQSRNKFLSRERMAIAGLPTPSYLSIPVASDPLRASARVVYPCVLKPLGLSASRGVIRANSPAEFVAAFERIRKILEANEIQRLQDAADRYVQVESYIEGREYAIEGLMTRGKLRVLAIFDKPDPLQGPFFEETLYTTPSRESADLQKELIKATDRATRALGLWHGPVHAELRHGPEGTFILEVAPRPIGGLCAQVLRFQGGISLEELILRHAVGEDVDLIEREKTAAAVLMIPIPKSGVYLGVDGVDAATSVLGIKEVIVTAKEGQRLLQLPEGSSYLGFAFAEAETPGEAETALRRAHQLLNFEIATELEVVKS